MPDTVLEVFFFTTVKRPVCVGAVSVISDPEAEVSEVVVSSADTKAGTAKTDINNAPASKTEAILNLNTF